MRTFASAATGVASFVGRLPHQGLCLTVRTADGYSVTLVHLGSIGVTTGTPVSEGDVVGTIGPSGDVEGTEPYVYLGIRLTADPNGYLDPLGLLPPRRAAEAASGVAASGSRGAAGAACRSCPAAALGTRAGEAQANDADVDGSDSTLRPRPDHGARDDVGHRGLAASTSRSFIRVRHRGGALGRSYGRGDRPAASAVTPHASGPCAAVGVRLTSAHR